MDGVVPTGLQPDPAQEQRCLRPFASTQRERHRGMLVDPNSPADYERPVEARFTGAPHYTTVIT
jgi:hypothetical protein